MASAQTPGQTVETVTTTADKIKVVLAVLAVAAGIVGFYLIAKQPMVARVGVVLAGFVVGLLIAYTSEPGRRFIGFARESYYETRRVVWPTPKEAFQTTLAVFAFAVVMALFLWGTDKTLEWIMYDLILGWKH